MHVTKSTTEHHVCKLRKASDDGPSLILVWDFEGDLRAPMIVVHAAAQ
jgi:hypothetical protein